MRPETRRLLRFACWSAIALVVSEALVAYLSSVDVVDAALGTGTFVAVLVAVITMLMRLWLLLVAPGWLLYLAVATVIARWGAPHFE
jgi:hypothetical protein